MGGSDHGPSGSACPGHGLGASCHARRRVAGRRQGACRWKDGEQIRAARDHECQCHRKECHREDRPSEDRAADPASLHGPAGDPQGDLVPGAVPRSCSLSHSRYRASRASRWSSGTRGILSSSWRGLAKLPAKAVLRPSNAGPDGLEGRLDDGGGLGHRVSGVEMERDDRALVGGQAGEGGAERPRTRGDPSHRARGARSSRPGSRS